MPGPGPNFPPIALVGFGEAAEAFLSGWPLDEKRAVRAFDIKTLAPQSRALMLERYRTATVTGAETLPEALAGAGLVFSLVTADQALAAAKAAAPALAAGTLWLDGNSCAPETKRQAATLIEAQGGRYVDMAVMAPVHPARHHTPLLIAGPHAEAALELLASLDMRATFGGRRIGDASSVKMIRSVMIKGIEALTAECLLAARRAGVEQAVLASLQASDPGTDWAKRGAYNLERMMVHGARRAAEMREVAVTVDNLGLPSRMAAATALWQDEIAALGLAGGKGDLADRVDRILARL